jgi:cobalamin biosynthesis protein CobC
MMAYWTWHGGGVEAASQRFGTGDWIDLSTGINPHPWPGAAALAIDWQRLPEQGDLRAMEAAAAAYFGVDADYVCAVPGTEIGLRLVGEITGGPACFVAPTYRTHGEMIAAAEAIVIEDAAARDGTLILANPNNPDGRILSACTLAELAERRRDGAWLLLDEAFADPEPGISLASRIEDDRRLVVFRSFGKFFGLAGVRLGFVLGPRAVVAAIRQKLGAWPVSAAAIAIGTAAYRDTAWIAGARKRLVVEAAVLDRKLRQFKMEPVGDCPLFRLVEVDDANALFERLARHHILTRPFADQPRWLRIGLPADRGALARLEAALADG